MSDSDSPAWDDLTIVGCYPTLALAHEHALVVLAMGLPCWVADAAPAPGFTLHAEPADAQAIGEELAIYRIEQQQTPRPAPTVPVELFHYPPGWTLYSLWAAALTLTFLWQIDHPNLVGLAASSSIGLIAHGEWWRPFTALFLHADVPHLLGNLLSGLLFGSLVARSMGPGRAWLAILACGTLGNTLTSLVTYPEPFVSLGASTAVFAALGILVGLGTVTMFRNRRALPWARLAAPLFGGIVLLGWLGGASHATAGTSQTDVLGHLFGFTAGLFAGLLTGWLSPATAGASTAGTATAAHGEPT